MRTASPVAPFGVRRFSAIHERTWAATAGLAIVLAVCSVLAGCASTPPAERKVPVTAENLPEVQRAGYTIVNRDGQKLYCRRERRTGSHARYETSCLTAEELEALKDATQRGVEAMRRTRPPPQDRG